MENILIGILLGMLIGFMIGWYACEDMQLHKQNFEEFAKWIAQNTNPLAPNIGYEWTILQRMKYSKAIKKTVRTEKLYELFLEHEKHK